MVSPRGFLQKKKKKRNLKICGQNEKFCKLEKAVFFKNLAMFLHSLVSFSAMQILQTSPTKPYLFLIKCRSLVKQKTKFNGSRSVNFVNSVNSKFWLQSQYINILAWSTKWSTGQKELDYPFQFHFDLNTNYFKVLILLSVAHAQAFDIK